MIRCFGTPFLLARPSRPQAPDKETLPMDKHWPFIRVLAIVALGMLASLPPGVHAMTDRERAGLVGPVR